MDNEDEIFQAVLERLSDNDKIYLDKPIYVLHLIRHEMGIKDWRLVDRVITTLTEEGLVRDGEWGENKTRPSQIFTEKGRVALENGGWPAYKKGMEVRTLKESQEAKWARVKLMGESQVYKYWWVAILISLSGLCWTIYHDQKASAHADEEFNQLRRQIDSLKKSQPVPTFKADKKPSAVSSLSATK